MKIIIFPARFRIGFLFSGCLYTAHHFNNGRLLDPGETAVTFGFSKTPTYSMECPVPESYLNMDSTGTHCVSNGFGGNETDGSGVNPRSQDSVPQLLVGTLPKGSFGYRLGVRGAWGPFTGVEMGWQIEVPTNPISVEFDLKFGLPVPKRKMPYLRHSLSCGWIVGMWADNSWFSEYAASRSFGNNALYGNYRVTYLATQPQNLEVSLAKWHFQSHQRIVQQMALGYFFKLPAKKILPDFFSPQICVTTPVVVPFETVDSHLLDKYQWNVNFGMGWNFK